MFVEKLNKKQEGVYVIEEEKTITDGKWEGFLDHDNVNHESITIYTGPKFTGEEVENYFISTPSETPWKTYLKVFSESEKIYITYESKGDQVEAEDINLVQESILDTRTELEQYKVANDNIVGNLDTRLVTVENGKAEKTYVDTELMKKADKSNTYTKAETDSRIQAIISTAPEALDTLAEIAEALNNDPDFAATVTNLLAQKVDKVAGKGLSTEDYTTAEKMKLAGIEEGANKYVHPNTHPASMITESPTRRFTSDVEKADWNSAVEHIGDGIRHITSAERTKWNAKAEGIHKHKTADITDFPSSLPANGGNADTVDGKHYSDITNYVDTSIGDIEIGGRNLISSLPINWQQGSFEGGSLAINNSYKARTLITDIEVSPNTQYTINLKDGYEVWIPELNENKTGVLNTRANFIGPTTFITTASTKYLYLSLRKTGTSYDSTNPEDFISPSDVPDINIKLEKGNKATDWTPAPEDVQAEIDSKVDNSRVLTNVPINAKFTDTIYTHPSTHPASMITESTTKRFASDTEKANWNGKAEISDIPTKVGQLENDKNYVTQEELGDAGYGDMLKSTYDQDNDGKVDQAETADNVPWTGVMGKPSTFTPSSHNHSISNISGLQSVLDNKMSKGPLTWNDIMGV